ncbi:indole-3-glycerol-phosphate synthase [Kitasatospora xanthocidica]|uniref:indole-3-glycerol-phosphate synthase n=1 Tax=Kitasatospora xanthocidica TaxID=83382 RepID=UPI00167C0BCF|nr:indole-3-glycerol-phosphate synthase [Kitasatospora xanthocidica]GHF86398.1 indole-3-glycerol-phosphate synthase [Kitasatospora xanthocidica]
MSDTTTGFANALLGARRPLVMEVKLRDPHGGDLLAGRTVTDLVTRYEQAGAPCLSVVTGRWFGGTTRLLRDVTAATTLPVLQKDFLTRPAQLEAAHAMGASAVLLTAALLPATSLTRLVTCALSLGLTPFVEITHERELDHLPHPESCVIAVNNKDIRTRERDSGDLERSLRLLPAVRATGCPAPVSASAITDPHTAARLLDAGYAGLLVGTALMRTDDIPTWLTTLDAARTGVAA